MKVPMKAGTRGRDVAYAATWKKRNEQQNAEGRNEGPVLLARGEVLEYFGDLERAGAER